MVKASTARPVKKPERAVALCDGEEEAAAAAEARRLAGIDQRKQTVASTMVYAGIGLRASERVTKTAPKKTIPRKPATTRPAAKTPAPTKPAAKKAADKAPTREAAIEPDAARPAPPAVAATAPDAPDKRKRSRTQSQLIGRLVETIDGQLDLIDAIMRDPHRGESGPGEAERYARTVAALARVTVELRKELEAGRRRRADDDSGGRDQTADADRPRDLDELRERLSRRLDLRLAGGSPVSVGDDAASRNRVPE